MLSVNIQTHIQQPDISDKFEVWRSLFHWKVLVGGGGGGIGLHGALWAHEAHGLQYIIHSNDLGWITFLFITWGVFQKGDLTNTEF